MTLDDQHGNPMLGGAESVALYDTAINAFLRFNPEVIAAAGTLVEEHPDVAMSQALIGYLYISSTDAPDVPTARAAWEAMGDTPMADRERAHHAALGAWTAGDWTGAADALDGLLERWPTDLLALQMGHQLDFFVGDAMNLRDRPGRTLPAMDPEHPHTPFVRGMQSFGLEEAGSYEAARAAGFAAVEAHPDDVWAIHAIVHTYEMEGKVDDGIRFLLGRTDDWGDGNLFTVHNWWHLALYLLEAGRLDDVLGIFDRRIHHAGSDGVPLEMVDASALLWRLFLDGYDTGDRFGLLADAWESRAEGAPWYAFNDLHGTVALVGAGRVADAERWVAELEQYVEAGGDGTNVAMTALVGLPAARAIVRFVQDRHDDVIADLVPVRRISARFGGSHAQRDLIVRTLTESALRAGRLDLARAVIAERLSLRDTSVYGWTQQARLERAREHEDAAGRAERTAAGHRERFAAAAGAWSPTV